MTGRIIGEIAPADAIELEMGAPALDRKINHRYEVQALPVARLQRAAAFIVTA